MTTNDGCKTCLDCEMYDSMPGNIYGVCLKGSYIDDDDDWYLQWICSLASVCEHFKELDA